MSKLAYFFKLAKRTDIQINSIEDLKQNKIGVVRGYAIEKQIVEAGLAGSLQRVTNDIQNPRKLFLERIELLPQNEMPVAYHLNLD